MQHQLLVGVGDGIDDGQEQLHAFAHRKIMRVDVVVQGLPSDQFADQVRVTLLAGAGVQQYGDIGVAQLCQRLAFAQEALHGGGAEVVADELEGAGLLELLCLFGGYIDPALSTGCKVLPDFPAADPLGSTIVLRVRHIDLSCRWLVEDRMGRAQGGDQFANFGDNRTRILLEHRDQQRFAAGFRRIEYLVETAIDQPPVRGAVLLIAHARARVRYALALVQSRRTVRSVTPRARAVSSSV